MIRERGGERGTTTGRDRAHRLARPGGAPLRGAAQRPDRAGGHQARRALRHRSAARRGALPLPRGGACSTSSPTTSRSCTRPRPSTRSSRASRGTSASAAREADLPPEARDYLDVHRRARRRPGSPRRRRPGPRPGDLDGRGRAPPAGARRRAVARGSPPTLDSRRHVREGPGRQPRRDRDPRHADARGDGHRLGRRLLGGRPRAPHVAEADEAFLLGPRGARRELSEHREAARGGRARPAPRRSTPATGSWPRTPASPPACEEAGIVFIGPPASAIEAMGSKTRARELMADAGRADRPGDDRARRERRRRQEGRRGDRLPGRLQGGRRRRRQGLSGRDVRGRARGRVRGRRPRGREVLLRPDRLPRALPGGSAPRRGAGARRLARQRDPPRRARLLDPAPPPEADRGGAGAARRRGDARADRQDRHRRRRGRRLPLAPARSRACRTARTTSSSR